MAEILGMIGSILSITQSVVSIAQTLYPEMDLNTVKEQIGNLTSEATIATFLAAVQSQIVAISYQDNATRIKVATNALGFAGVLLDVSAACFALLAGTVLQRHIAVVEKQLDAIEDASPDQLTATVHFLSTSPRHIVSPDIRRRVFRKAQKRLIALMESRTENPDVDPQSGELAESPELDISSISRSLMVVQNVTFIGDVAENALLWGILCFLASVQCLAISTQPRVVWVITAVLTSSVVALYPLSQFSGRARNQWVEFVGFDLS